VTHVVCASVSRAVVVPAAAGLHIVSWGVQIYGHAVYEGGMPALSESVVGSIATAPLFVVLEMLWSMGYALPLWKRLAAEDRR
jgi:2-hydroxy fatty acid dioxygenase